jgi:hypothetical protein
MRRDELLGEIDVCEDCLFIHANGEYLGDPRDRTPDMPEAWALWGFGYHATMGGEHSETCTEADRDEGCECDRRGFSWQSCEGCGSGLGGDRYRFTMWRVRPEYAHVAARLALESARVGRKIGDRLFTAERLVEVAQWREYLASIAAETRRHNIWMARMRQERLAA